MPIDICTALGGEALYDALASNRVPPRARSGLALSAAAMALNDLRHLVAYIDQAAAGRPPCLCMSRGLVPRVIVS